MNKKPKKEDGFLERITYRFSKRHRDSDNIYLVGQLIDLSDQKAARWITRGIVTRETILVESVDSSIDL